MFPKKVEVPADDMKIIDEIKKETSSALFSFIEVEDVFKQDNKTTVRTLMNYLRPLSVALNQANMSNAFHYMLDAMICAHNSCRNYAKSMRSNFQEATYIEEFKASRVKTFNDFMIVFKEANRGHLINNYNMYLMSMPMEYEPESNFLLAYAL